MASRREGPASGGGQSKTGPAPKTSKIITNDEIAGASEPAVDVPASGGKETGAADAAHSSAEPKIAAGEWKARISRQKELINALQGKIDKLNGSIRFTDGNCVSWSVQWSERQRKKQQEAERMPAQLETQKQHLQEMQEAGRQQGHGSLGYEP